MHSVLTSESDHVTSTSSKVMVNGDIIFNVNGDVQILALRSECYTANDATASRVTYVANSALDGSHDISGQSASLANATVGTAVICDNTTLTSAPTVSQSGIALNMDSRGITIPRGTISITVNGGSTTGLWRHYIRYEPLEPGAWVEAGF